MAAIAIAMKQYEIDNGQRPAALGDLVPKYLAAIPADPFSAAGEPIKLGAWGGRRLLYSIGENMVDEKGQYAASPSERPEIDNYDAPFFLDGDRPRPPTETSVTSKPATTATSAPASAPNSVGQNRRK